VPDAADSTNSAADEEPAEPAAEAAPDDQGKEQA
jgi:hypothetical protein